MLPHAETLARRIAAITGLAPDSVAAACLLALAAAQLAAARPALDGVRPMDDPAEHAAALRDLAAHG